MPDTQEIARAAAETIRDDHFGFGGISEYELRGWIAIINQACLDYHAAESQPLVEAAKRFRNLYENYRGAVPQAHLTVAADEIHAVLAPYEDNEDGTK